MAIEDIPVWYFEPNWTNALTESFEWLTSILASPTGAEQRRALRIFPRKELEFSVTAGGSEAAALDRAVTVYGATALYLPLWHEAFWLETSAANDATTIRCQDADSFGAGTILFIGSTERSSHYELVEVASVTGDVITLSVPLENAWPAFSKVHPVRKARLADQPSVTRITDSALTLTVNFKIIERNDDADNITLETYSGFPVYAVEPNEGQANNFQYERKLEEFDNQTGFALIGDTAGRAFRKQTFSWSVNGRNAYAQLKALLYRLRGKQKALWLPSFNQDFEVTANVATGQQILTVRDIGFTESGGAGVEAKHICIFMTDGSRLYRQIVSSSQSSNNTEILFLNQAFASAISKDAILRVSFMRLSRLDQDRIEISHKTDTMGVSDCAVGFRAAPNIRQELAGF